MGKRLTERGLASATTRRFNEAGITNGSIHRIRRTVSSMLNQLLPQKTVAELLGHNELTNEAYYNYSTAGMAEKRTALCSLYEAMNDIKTA